MRAVKHTSTLDGMNGPALTESAKLLDEVVDINRVLVDPRTGPRAGSPADAELRKAQQQPGPTGAWGEGPVRAAYALAVMNYQVALDHASAMVVLTNGELSAVSVSVLARALVEVASQAWWLLEPGIGHAKRVRRLLALRYRSAREGEKAATADGVPADDHRTYTETTAQIERDAHDLGLETPSVDRSKRWTVYVCGSQQLPTASWRVERMFSDIDLPSVYPIFSGYSHGELFALLREFEMAARGLDVHYRPVVNEESFKGAVAVASYALHPPAERLIRLYGLSDAR